MSGEELGKFERIADLRFEKLTSQIYEAPIGYVHELLEEYANEGIHSQGKFLRKAADLICTQFRSIEEAFEQAYIRPSEQLSSAIEGREQWLCNKMDQMATNETSRAKGVTAQVCAMFGAVPAANRPWIQRIDYESRLIRTRLNKTIKLSVLEASPASAPARQETPSHRQPVRAQTEAKIIDALDQLLPPASASYQQVLADLDDPSRVSYRGTATELRECVRNVLDHLAPDEEVMHSPGFTFENSLDKPTMKQKARFILKSRDAGDAESRTAEDAASVLEQSVASLARSVYTRGSVSSHTTTALEEIRQFKLYADALLAELLQIHKTTA